MRPRPVVLLLALALLILGLLPAAGCGSATAPTTAPGTPSTTGAPPLKVAALKGPTGMGMVQLMEGQAGKERPDYAMTLFDAPDALLGKVVTGEFDAAALPTNSAAIIHAKTGGAVQLAAVNTLGVVSILEAGDTVHSLGDLRGRTILASGKGSTADVTLRYLLDRSGLAVGRDATVTFAGAHADVATAAAAGDAPLVLLPQPFATVAMTKNPRLRVAVDISTAWETATGAGSVLPMGSLVVNTAYATRHRDQIRDFLTAYRSSVAFANDQPQRAGELMAKHGIVAPAAVAAAAIPRSHLVYIDAQAARPSVDAFLTVLFAFDPAAVGGKVPDDGFYYRP